MSMDTLRGVMTRRPGWVVGIWFLAAAVVGLTAPDLTRLAAEGQAKLINHDAESVVGGLLVQKAWPEQTFASLAVLVLEREGGLQPADRDYAGALASRFESATLKPADVLRVMGPNSIPAIAERLVSKDGTTQLIAIPMNSACVAPSVAQAVTWLEEKTAEPGLAAPAGLKVRWTGDAVIGRDYMADVQTSLDRAALATVVLLMVVLLIVYRSVWLALIPLGTIGVSLVISRGLLAWLAKAGWEISPLVELFLVALLFGSGTDFCLFLSWRFAEHWNPKNPGLAMRVTLKRASVALITSASTVIIGLSLMGTTRFKLFSTTGPSVALGLVLTVLATLSLTPALLVLLAKFRPSAFHGMTRPSSGFWDRVAHWALAHPAWSWSITFALMLPLAWLGTRTHFLNDIISEMPEKTASVANLRLVAEKFGAGQVAPLTVVLESDKDLRTSQGLALIDDVSRMLSRQRKLAEVRSATQPLGSTAPLEPARLASRLGAVNDGLRRITAGNSELRDRLADGLTKLKAARWVERVTGLKLVPGQGPSQEESKAARESLAGGLKSAAGALFGAGATSVVNLPELAKSATPSTIVSAPVGSEPAKPASPDNQMVNQLAEAVSGASQLADGAGRAEREVTSILKDPVGRKALDRLLITPETVRDNPELLQSFDAYITADGKYARIDISQDLAMFSEPALNQVETLRRRLKDYLDEEETFQVKAYVSGPNAGAADLRSLTESDQIQSWFLVPAGVFLVLIVALRDPLACINLVATMVLTYLFALGATHLVFVQMLGAGGLDWKVPYFLFVLLVAVGVDYNVFLMARLQEETGVLGLKEGITRAVAQTGGLITSAAAITAVSFASFLFSPLHSLQQLGFALVVGIAVDATLVRPLLVPCGHWLLYGRAEQARLKMLAAGSSAEIPAMNDYREPALVD